MVKSLSSFTCLEIISASLWILKNRPTIVIKTGSTISVWYNKTVPELSLIIHDMTNTERLMIPEKIIVF